MSDPNVFTYLDAKTSHISFKTSEFLEAVAGTNSIGQTVATYGYGFFVSIPPKPEYHDSVPNDLRMVLDFGRSKGCFVLRLDADADTIDELPKFNWEDELAVKAS